MTTIYLFNPWHDVTSSTQMHIRIFGCWYAGERTVHVLPAVLQFHAPSPTSKRFLTPDKRTLRVPRESRARLARGVVRVARVPRESRRRIVPAERRTLGVPRESRTLKG